MAQCLRRGGSHSGVFPGQNQTWGKALCWQGLSGVQLWAPSCQGAGGSAILGQGQGEPELKARGSTGNLYPSPGIAFHCVSPAGPRTGHPEGQLRGLQSSLSLFLLNPHTRVKLMVPAGAGLWVGPLAVSLVVECAQGAAVGGRAWVVEA